jgi:hypothetical protein
MFKCKNCHKEADEKEVSRVQGELFLKYGQCSARCYTEYVQKYDPNYIDERGIYVRLERSFEEFKAFGEGYVHPDELMVCLDALDFGSAPYEVSMTVTNVIFYKFTEGKGATDVKQNEQWLSTFDELIIPNLDTIRENYKNG